MNALATAARHRMSTRTFVIVGLLVALLLAGVVSFYASSRPDGLERVAADHGMTQAEQQHAAKNGPFADYQTKGVDNGRLSGGLAGVVGSLVVLTLAGGLVLVVRRRRTPDDVDG